MHYPAFLHQSLLDIRKTFNGAQIPPSPWQRSEDKDLTTTTSVLCKFQWFFFKKISVILLNAVELLTLPPQTQVLYRSCFVNNFCFQKLFPLSLFLPWLCHRILSSIQKTGEKTAVESCWVTLCSRKQAYRRSNNPDPLPSEHTPSLLSSHFIH